MLPSDPAWYSPDQFHDFLIFFMLGRKIKVDISHSRIRNISRPILDRPRAVLLRHYTNCTCSVFLPDHKRKMPLYDLHLQHAEGSRNVKGEVRNLAPNAIRAALTLRSLQDTYLAAPCYDGQSSQVRPGFRLFITVSSCPMPDLLGA